MDKLIAAICLVSMSTCYHTTRYRVPTNDADATACLSACRARPGGLMACIRTCPDTQVTRNARCNSAEPDTHCFEHRELDVGKTALLAGIMAVVIVGAAVQARVCRDDPQAC